MRKTVFFVLFFIYMTGCQASEQKEIDEIYFYHADFGLPFQEYKIDLKNKMFWSWERADLSERIKRDDSANDEGYTFVCALEDEKIGEFLRQSARYGLTKWKESYVNERIMDGHQCGMTITFHDAAELTVDGSNKYPPTWDKMYDVFTRLTGEEILMLKSDWGK